MAQEYLNGRKDDASENARRRRIEESIARKSVEKFGEEEIRRQQEVTGQKDELKEMTRQYQKRLLEEEQRLRRELEEKEKWNIANMKTGGEKSLTSIVEICGIS